MVKDVAKNCGCIYLTLRHAQSFWGRYMYLYEGTGWIRLESDRLVLSMAGGEEAIPFHAIKSLGLGWFSLWSKPFGLSRLEIWVSDGEEDRSIALVPYHLANEVTPETCRVVEDWYWTLAGVEELSGRIEPPQPAPRVVLPTRWLAGLGMAAAAVLMYWVFQG